MADADGDARSLVLLDIDLEGLDFILRTFGPRERDTLVAEVGRRLGETAGPASALYHITQGRFAVVLPQRSFRQSAEQARRVVATLRAPVEKVASRPALMKAC